MRRFAETYREYVTISRSDVIQREYQVIGSCDTGTGYTILGKAKYTAVLVYMYM